TQLGFVRPSLLPDFYYPLRGRLGRNVQPLADSKVPATLPNQASQPSSGVPLANEADLMERTALEPPNSH
ncbi:MAG: hypothetical protein ACK55S_09380, partial [Planctomycetota bacterium]